MYNLPVMESIYTHTQVSERGSAGTAPATALYIYPTKALAQDQLQSIRSLTEHIERVNEEVTHCNDSTPTLPHRVCNVCAVDGDTSFSQRTFAQKSCNVLLTNPDMLSCTLLPNHKQWKRFFSGIRYVVIDEAHMYTGVFGSHVSAVMRRLTRVCSYYRQQEGSDFTQQPLQFVLSSATIANPLQHMRKLVPIECLTGKRDDNHNNESNVVSVDSSSDGSPSGDRYFVLWNPPIYVAAEHMANKEVGEVKENHINDNVGKKQRLDVMKCGGEMSFLTEDLKENEKVTSVESVMCPASEGSECLSSFVENSFVRDKKPRRYSPSSHFDYASSKVETTSETASEGFESIMSDDAIQIFLRGCEDGSSAVGTRFGPENRTRYREKRSAVDAIVPSSGDMGGVTNSLDQSIDASIPPPGRTSSIVQTALLFSSLIIEKRRVLAFCNSRKLVELVSLFN